MRAPRPLGPPLRRPETLLGSPPPPTEPRAGSVGGRKSSARSGSPDCPGPLGPRGPGGLSLDETPQPRSVGGWVRAQGRDPGFWLPEVQPSPAAGASSEVGARSSSKSILTLHRLRDPDAVTLPPSRLLGPIPALGGLCFLTKRGGAFPPSRCSPPSAFFWWRSREPHHPSPIPASSTVRRPSGRRPRWGPECGPSRPRSAGLPAFWGRGRQP